MEAKIAKKPVKKPKVVNSSIVSKEIDDLFKPKTTNDTSNLSNVPSSSSKRKAEDKASHEGVKTKGKGEKVKSKKRSEEEEQEEASEDSEEDDDGGFETIDDDIIEEGSSQTYGLIQSRYKKSKIINPEAPIERIDPQSGFKVYKAHLLKVGDGGGTALCPFDCNCCF